MVPVRAAMHYNPRDPIMAAVMRIVHGHGMMPSERVMIEHVAVVVHDVDTSMVSKPPVVMIACGDDDMAAAKGDE